MSSRTVFGTGAPCPQPALVGIATLVAGTVVVPCTSVKASSLVFLTAKAAGGTAGIPACSAVNAGVGFTILSSQAADTATVQWMVVNPY